MFVGIFLRMFCESYAKERATHTHTHIYIYIKLYNIHIYTHEQTQYNKQPSVLKSFFFQAMTVSSQEALLPHMGPAKDKHGVRESLDS